MKKAFSFIINLILLISMLSISVFAEEVANGTTDADNTTDDTVQEIVYNSPEEIHGVLVSPGEDFAKEKLQDEASVKAQIDSIIATMDEYSLNTAYLNLQTREGTIYPSDYYPSYTSFDALQYFIEKARDNEIYVYTILNPCYVTADDVLVDTQYIYNDVIEQAQKNISEVVSKYDIDALLIEGYYNSFTQDSFEQYKKYSAGMGFDQWIKESATSLVKALADTSAKVNPAVQFGLVCDSVWANSTTLENGSATSGEFEMYTDGYVDLPTIMTISNVKTLLVKLPGSLTNKQIPFKTTLSWWQNFASQYGADVCSLIYNSKLSTDERGWASPDQVIQQLIAMQSVKAKGAAFASYKHIEANNDGHSELIERYFKGNVKIQDILTTLTVSRPEQLTYSTYEPVVSFYGASDPNFPLLLNGEEVTRNDKGVFSLEIDLAVGVNTFSFTHKTKTVTYNITRNVKIIQSVAPEGSMTVEGDSTVPISVYAYKNSSVVANVGGAAVQLYESTSEGDNTDKNSSYVLYVGNYACPSSTESVQNVGNINITATWQGITETATGANIRITALPPPEIVPGEKGNMIEVVASQARTYPSGVLNADPSGDCFPLPKGSRDFIASDLLTFASGGTTYNYYILRSGVRVNAADVQVLGEVELVANNMTEASLYPEAGYVYLKIKQDQPMAFNANLPGLGFNSTNGVSSFSSTALTLTFNQVENIPESLAFTGNNVFSSASVSKNGSNAVITLNFHRAGRFAGYRAYYQDGYLIFRFTDIPSSLSGAKIYLDPGHGGYDSGALPIEGMKTEAQINREIANKAAEILRSRGANVQVTDTTGYVGLDSRVSMSQSYAPHVFVSIHQNSSTSPSATGTEVWFFNPYSEIYADRISSALSGALGTKDRGEKYGLYKVTTHMDFPAVLVECGFLSNVTEYDKLKDDGYQTAMANAIADGITAAFNAK